MTDTDPPRQLPPLNPGEPTATEAALRRIKSAALVLGCTDLAAVGLWHDELCCPHCHDAGDGYPARRPSWAPPLALTPVRVGNRLAELCCKAALTVKQGA